MDSRITTSKLFQLIKTLKKEEKRYFKLFTKNNAYKQGKYLEIFDVLNKQDVLDINRYKQRLKHIKQLSSLQSYLYEQILQSLQAQHTGNSIERQIMDGMIRIELLFERHLVVEAEALVYKIETLAIDYDKSIYLPNIYMWWFKIQNSFLRYKTVSNDQFKVYQNKMKTMATVLSDYTQYYTAVSEGVYLKQYKSSRSISVALQQLEKEVDDYTPKEAEAIPVKIIYLQLKAFFSSAKYDYSKAYSYWYQLCLFIEAMPKKLFDHYQRLYHDIIQSYVYKGSFVAPANEIPELLKRLESIPNHDKTTYLIAVKHKLLLKMNQPLVALDFIRACELNFEHLPLNYKFTFHYNLGVNYFILKQYDQALDALDVILESKSFQVPHIRLAAFILKVITFYEKDEYLVLPYLLSSIRRQLKSTGSLFHFEEFFLNFIKKIIKRPKSDRKPLFIKFKKQYLEFVNGIEQSEEMEFFIFFNYEEWFNAHISNQDFKIPFP